MHSQALHISVAPYPLVCHVAPSAGQHELIGGRGHRLISLLYPASTGKESAAESSAFAMPPIFQAQRTATVAFAPNAPFLATGSFSGAVDASFSTDSSLQVIKRASAAPHRRECRTCRLAQCWSLDTRITTARTRWAACYTGPVWPARNHWAWKHVFVCNTQIYSVDFASSNGGQLQRVGGSVKVSESFERVTWGAIGLNPASYPVHPTSLPSHSELLTTCAAHRSVSSQLQCWYTCKQPAGCSQCGARCPISE